MGHVDVGFDIAQGGAWRHRFVVKCLHLNLLIGLLGIFEFLSFMYSVLHFSFACK